MVRRDAGASLEWRLIMWRAMLPELPNYIFLGKGYAYNPTDLYLAQQATRHARAPHQAVSIVAGDYHSGPLSLYVPFGSVGVLAFLGFVLAALRALYLNYRYGPEELRTINRFLFAFFVARFIFFVGVFGSLSSDMFQFTSVVGLSVALNKGVCRKREPQPAPFVRLRPNPAFQTA